MRVQCPGIRFFRLDIVWSGKWGVKDPQDPPLHIIDD